MIIKGKTHFFKLFTYFCHKFLIFWKIGKAMKIIINGLGRIGKLVFRRLCDKGLYKNILLVNEKEGSPEDQEYFLKYDSVHGSWGDFLTYKNNFYSILIEENKLISLRGTLVPATTINKFIGSIPVLGKLLVGTKTGEGVFGVSFKIKGPPKNLETTVNPIKTLTPRFITRTLEKIKKN